MMFLEQVRKIIVKLVDLEIHQILRVYRILLLI